MRVPISFTFLWIAGIAVLAGLVCRADQTNVFPHLRFVVVDVRVVDSATSRPVVGASVLPLCLGGTPYATNSYRTDTNGVARVTSYQSITAVRVTMDGYQQAGYAFLPTNGLVSNAVVKMKRVQK